MFAIFHIFFPDGEVIFWGSQSHIPFFLIISLHIGGGGTPPPHPPNENNSEINWTVYYTRPQSFIIKSRG